jgi:UDP-N-acetylglucosamine 3-dehydrogenase
MRVGVIGVGSMGKNHVRVYSEIADLVGVTDVMQDSSRSVAEKFGVRSYESPIDLLKDVDAVSICTPTSEHLKMARMAIEQGVSLLVEKPFTGKSETAAELVEMAEKAKVTLASGFIERCNPIVGNLQGMVAAKRFGDVISIASRRVSSFPARIRDVGVILDLGIHDVDVLRYVKGSEVRSVFALGGSYNAGPCEDFANLLLEFQDGGLGFIEVNWLTPMKVRKMSLTCSEAFVQADYIDQSMEISSSSIKDLDPGNLFNLPLELDVHRIAVKKEEPLKIELQNFLKAAGAGTEAPISGRDAVSNLKVCEAALRSLKSKGKERVEV